MKFADGLSSATTSSPVAPRLPESGQQRGLLEKSLAVLTGVACAYLLLMLLPDSLGQLALDVLGWFVIGVLAVAALVMSARILENILDL